MRIIVSFFFLFIFTDGLLAKVEKPLSATLLPEREKQLALSSQTKGTPELQAHPPLVTDHNNGQFTVNPKADALREEMINMSKVAFLMRKNDPTVPEKLQTFRNESWGISPFVGKSGLNNSVEDEPGFVAYRAKDNVMIVTFRGSDSTVSNPETGKAADWEVNFDAEMIQTPQGKMHKGFYNKVQAAHASLMQTIEKYIKPLSPEKKASLQIFFTGHSQGAALAPLAAANVVNEIKKSGLLGPNFDNALHNTVQTHVFSAPRALGDQEALDHLHGTLGKHNIIRQNVTGVTANDPVTVASPGKTATALLKLVPVVGQKLAEKYGGGSGQQAGARSAGYLAADKASDVSARVKETESKSLLKQYAGAVDEVKKKVEQNPKDMPGTIKNIAQTGGKIIEKTGKALLAPLHYGGITHESPVEDGKAYTNPRAMKTAPETSKLLSQGVEHKEAQRSGIGGAIRRNIEQLADQKVALENKIVKDAKKIGGFLSNPFKNK